MGRIIKIILAAVPVIIIAAVIALYFSLNSIIKHGVETVGPKATGVDVKLQKADISLFSGEGELKGFFIGNPEGFKTASAFQLNHVRIALNVKSVFSDRIIIDEILIDAPDITYEKSAKGDNIKTILNNIKKFAGTEKKAAQEPAGEQPKSEAKKIVIKDFLVRNGKVNMSATLLEGERLSYALPEIHMKNIGEGEGGASLSKAMESIFAEVNKGVITAASGSVKDIGKTVEKTAKKAAGKEVEKAVDTLKGILGK